MKLGSLYSKIDAIFEVTGVQAQQMCYYTGCYRLTLKYVSKGTDDTGCQVLTSHDSGNICL